MGLGCLCHQKECVWRGANDYLNQPLERYNEGNHLPSMQRVASVVPDTLCPLIQLPVEFWVCKDAILFKQILPIYTIRLRVSRCFLPKSDI